MEGLETLSDPEQRKQIRKLLARWSAGLNCFGDTAEQARRKSKFINKLRELENIAVKTEAANEQHYEVPTDFYLRVLGPRLKYSSGWWEDGANDLKTSEDAMFELYCSRARLDPSVPMTILDLGCGWGSLSFWIAEHYPLATITAVSNSSTQREHINGEATRRGFGDRLKAHTCDINVFNPGMQFDRVMSIECLEHMRNYEKLFSRLATWIKPTGYLFVQILCHREHGYLFDGAGEWMTKNFFTGGTMPSADLFLYFQKDISIVDLWRVNGVNYSKTLEAWLEKQDRDSEAVKAILRREYGEEEGNKQFLMWRTFFIYCSEVFNFRGGDEWQVAHLLFRPNGNLAARL